ncbi:MAG: hypothetical protein N3A38_16415 [Planctomycetota bacterium]|nr:hypothetical protein [Planctomycetota bacterium]
MPRAGAVGNGSGFRCAWDFSKGPDKSAPAPILGAWEWEAGQEKGGRGGMVCRRDALVGLPLPVEDVRPPIKVSVRAAAREEGSVHALVLFRDGKAFQPCLKWARHLRILEGRIASKREFAIFLLGRHVIAAADGVPVSLLIYDAPPKKAGTVLFLGNLTVERIEIASLADRDVPTELRDVEDLKIRLGVNPVAISSDGSERPAAGSVREKVSP